MVAEETLNHYLFAKTKVNSQHPKAFEIGDEYKLVEVISDPVRLNDEVNAALSDHSLDELFIIYGHEIIAVPMKRKSNRF